MDNIECHNKNISQTKNEEKQITKKLNGITSEIENQSLKNLPKKGWKRKHSRQEIEDIFKEAGCEVMSIYKVKNKNKIRYKCSCGNLSETRLDSFKLGSRCKDCGIRARKYSDMEVHSSFSEEGFLWLSGEYRNFHSKLKVKCCKCEYVFLTTFCSFSAGNRCANCSQVRKYTYEEVKAAYEKAGCVLLSEIYIDANSKLNYICPNGHETHNSFGALQRGNKCGVCTRLKLRGQRHLNYGWKGYQEISGSCWAAIKASAKERKYELDITIEYLWDLFIEQKRKCALSGMDIKFATNSSSNDKTASLDRIDNSKGYIKGNVQWVHVDVNYAKQNLDEKYFIEICGKIWDNSKDKYSDG